MSLLDRPDSTMLLVIMAVCIGGLLLLAAATFFPGVAGRLRPGRPADAYPNEPVSLADRLGPTYGADPSYAQATAAQPALADGPEPTATPAPAKHAAAKRAPAKRAATKTATKTAAKKTTVRSRTTTGRGAGS